MAALVVVTDLVVRLQAEPAGSLAILTSLAGKLFLDEESFVGGLQFRGLMSASASMRAESN